MFARRSLVANFAIFALLGMAAGCTILLSSCSQAPAPTAMPTSTAVSATHTATAAAVTLVTATLNPPTATQSTSPSPQPSATSTALPSPSASATPSITATITPQPVARFVPTPTTGAPTARPPAPAVPVPTANAPIAATSQVKDRVWDPRLTQRGAVLIPAQVQPGQGYWRLVQGQWFDVDEPPFGGQHHIFVDALDQAGKRQVGVRIQMASHDLKDSYGYVTTEPKPGESYAGSFPMFIVAPIYRVEPADGAPADAVTGLGLGSITVPDLPMLTSYGLTWQWTVLGKAVPTATPIASGANPDAALTVPLGVQRLAAGQRIWYAFRYAGDVSLLTIQMRVVPPGAATFALWSTADVQRWTQGNPETPVGRGSPSAEVAGELIWIGSFNAPGIYYVVVDQTGPYTGSFSFQVTGSGVSPAGKSP